MARKIIGPLLLVVAVATITYFIVREDMLGVLLDVEVGLLGWIMLISGIGLAIRGQQLAVVTRPYGVRFSRGESTGLSALHTLSNYLPGRAGILVRGAYLYRFHQVSAADYTAVTALWLVGSLLSAVLLGLAVSAVAVQEVHRSLTLMVFGASGAALIAGYAALEFIVSRGTGNTRATRWLHRVQRGLRLWREPGVWRAWFAVWSFGLLLVMALRYWLALTALGDTSGFAAALIIQCLVSLSVLVSVTPGNVGVREGVAAFGAMLTGVDPQIALLAALIDRAAALVISLIGFVLLGRPLVRKHREQGSSPGEAA